MIKRFSIFSNIFSPKTRLRFRLFTRRLTPFVCTSFFTEVLLNEEEISEDLDKLIRGEPSRAKHMGEMTTQEFQELMNRQKLLQHQRQLQFSQELLQKTVLIQQQQQQRQHLILQERQHLILQERQKQNQLIQQQQQQQKRMLYQHQQQQEEQEVVSLDDDDDDDEEEEEQDPLAVTPDDYIRALKAPDPMVQPLPKPVQTVETATLTLPPTKAGDLPRKVIVPRTMLNSSNKLSLGSSVLKVAHCQMCGPGLLYSIDFIRQHILQAHGANKQSVRLPALLNTL